jgi:two-component system, chemotaxis family, chemotaxis protein CheY
MARILVVDDDEVVRVMLQETLEASGHVVSFAPNGDIAVRAFDAQPFDIVIMDLALPVKSGLQAIREITTSHPKAQVVAISGVNAELLPKAEDYGACRVLIKPLDAKQVQDTVMDLTTRRTAWDGVWR